MKLLDTSIISMVLAMAFAVPRAVGDDVRLILASLQADFETFAPQTAAFEFPIEFTSFSQVRIRLAGQSQPGQSCGDGIDLPDSTCFNLEGAFLVTVETGVGTWRGIIDFHAPVDIDFLLAGSLNGIIGTYFDGRGTVRIELVTAIHPHTATVVPVTGVLTTVELIIAGESAAGGCCVDGQCLDVGGPLHCAEAAFVCDAGAYAPGPQTACFGDADANGVVNPADRGFVSANIGRTDAAGVCWYDLDGNGLINPADRGVVSAHVGQCEPLPDYQNGSGLNGGAPDTRFASPEWAGSGTGCASAECL